MPYFTNVNPADIPNSGELIASGTVRHDCVIAIRDAIINAAGGEILEVTGAGPTPAQLQPFASNVTVGGTSYTSNGNPVHTTLYWANDADVAAGHGRLIRLYSARRQTAVSICGDRKVISACIAASSRTAISSGAPSSRS